MRIEHEKMRWEDEKLRREDERMHREEKMHQLKRNKEERIMMMDISGLLERQRQYYDQLQMDILESWMKKT